MSTPTWLHVFATFGRGGPQVRTTQVMAAIGASVRHLVLAMDGCTEARALVPASVPLQVLPPLLKQGTFATARAIAKVLLEHKPDLLLTYNWGAIDSLLAARRLRVRAVVHHEEGFGPEEQSRRLWRRNLARRFLLRWPYAVVVPSLGLRAIAEREWRVPQSRLHHLPNGVDLQRFQPLSRATGPLVVGTVGGLRAEKDHATLLRACSRLDCRVTVVGEGPLRPALERLCDELGMRQRVEFTGLLADPAAAYHSFDVFALASRTEQMPLSLLEAMASGLPVAGSDVGDVRHMLPADCRKGLVPAGDPAALSASLQALLGDADRRRREGRSNRAHCEANYGLQACLDRYLELYRSAPRAFRS